MENVRVADPRAGEVDDATPRPLSKPRAALLDRLRDQPEPLSLTSLKALTGLHENTLREHLTALTARGLVRRQQAPVTGRGRPGWLYESTLAEPGGSAYAKHAAALTARIVESAATPHTAITEATAVGRAWGRRLARARGAVPALPHVARREVVRLFDSLGFETRRPLRESPVVRLTHCPLLEEAHRNLDVVCAMHLGLAQGALAEYGGDPEGMGLVPFKEPGACHLTVPPMR